ncbi:hypothetical protein GCM10009819_21970 [Agromyces tropicus]|uniref:Uncharacterized protein n=2 Tax=Agromyces tropicus TaxID=555371 RepID=A0ABN2UI50_9MICO
MVKVGAGVGLAAALTLGSGMAAYAHECYNANRSDKGNQGASNSQAWYTIVVADEVSAGLDAEDAECVLDAYYGAGGPATFTIHVKGANGQDGTIGEANPVEGKSSDGKGIDHVFDAYGGIIFGAYEACGVEFG